MEGRLRIKKRKKKTKKNFRLIVLILAVLMVAEIFHLISVNDHLNIEDLNIAFYIEAADDASQNRIQINWQYLAAIDCVRYNHDFSKADYQSVIALANLFVVEKPSSDKNTPPEYRLRSLPAVMGKLAFTTEQKAKVYHYLQDLEYVGLVNNKACFLEKESAKLEFIDSLTGEAMSGYYQYGIFPSITIAQAILESGWGTSVLSVQGHNLFGIKADSSWEGKYLTMKTMEYYNSQTCANFRKYQNVSECMQDHGEFLNSNQRYRQNGVFDAAYYVEQAQALENAGYGTKTDKNGNKIYADLLIEIIKQYNLQLIDYKVQS
ncbi:MAG: glucosaminidase domain-containing protein [Syntrophomonadaceae bacterium]|nr:glucosaminidase domain-containing protein [Syntrophomonadaceae bacterium]